MGVVRVRFRVRVGADTGTKHGLAWGWVPPPPPFLMLPS